VFDNDKKAITEYFGNFISVGDLVEKIGENFKWIAEWGLAMEPSDAHNK
jgi:hypothetical protein